MLEAKRGKDPDRYKLAQEKLSLVAPCEKEATVDKEWLDRVLKENSAQTRRLEDELKGYKNNLIKESIRVRHTDSRNYTAGANQHSRWVTKILELTIRKSAI